MRSTLGFPTRGNKSSSTCISTHSLWFIYFRNLLFSPTGSNHSTCLSHRYFSSTRSNLQITHEQRVLRLWLLSGLDNQTSYLFRPSFSHRHFRSRSKPLYATHSSVAAKITGSIDSTTLSQIEQEQRQKQQTSLESCNVLNTSSPSPSPSPSSSSKQQRTLLHPRWLSKIKNKDIDLFLQQLKEQRTHLEDKFVFKSLRSRLYNASQYRYDDAWKIYLAMVDLNVIDYMNANHYGHLLNIIKYSPQATSQLLSILDQMKMAKKAGLITISDLHYSQVLYGMARQGSAFEMCHLLDELKTESLLVSHNNNNDMKYGKKWILPASCYTSLAIAAKKNGNMDITLKAAGIIEEAMKAGVSVEMEACAIMISALGTNMDSTVRFLTVMDQIGMMTKYTNNNDNDTQLHNNNNSNYNIHLNNNNNNINHTTTTINNNNNNTNNNNSMDIKTMNSFNVHIYTTLISGLARNGDAINARRLWKEMRSHGLRPTTATYNAMVEAYGRSGNLKAAIQMLKKYTYEHNGRLNELMATSVLSNTIRHGRLDLAQSLLNTWTDKMGLKLDNMDDEFKTAVMWVKVLEDVDQGLYFFNTLYKTNTDYVNSIMVNHLVKGYGDLKDKKGVQDSFALHKLVNSSNSIRSSKYVNPDYYLVDALFKCRDVPAALSAFIKMRQCGLPDDITLAMVIRGLVMNDEGVTAWKLFKILKMGGVEPNLHAYTSILRSCVPKPGNKAVQQQHSKSEITPELLSEVFNISNSSSTTTAAILDNDNKLGPTQAYILFRKMTGFQKPNVYTYTTLIACFAKYNIGRAVDIFKYMCTDGVEPTIETYVALLQGCAIFRNGRMALMVYQHLRDNQLTPNDKVWHYLLKALVRSRVNKNEIDKLGTMIRGEHKTKN